MAERERGRKVDLSALGPALGSLLRQPGLRFSETAMAEPASRPCDCGGAMTLFQEQMNGCCDRCFDARSAAEAEERKAVRMGQFAEKSGVGARYAGMSFESWDPDRAPIPAAVARWNHAAGQNLVLFGPAGAGKTHLAVAALRRAYEAGASCAYVSVPDIRLELIQDGGRERRDLLDRWLRVRVLVLDDFNRVAQDDRANYAEEMVETIVDRRYRHGFPIVVTTNRSPKVLYGTKDSAGGDPRTWSRILHGATVVKMDPGSDQRLARPAAGKS